MGLGELTRENVQTAVAEFNELGRDEFLKRHGLVKATSYFLEIDESLYDAKPVAARALGRSKLVEKDKAVAARLTALKFDVRHFPQAPWTRDEIVLACAVLEANGWKRPGGRATGWQLVELSELLQSGMFHPVDQHGPDFRSRGSVAFKIANIQTVRAGYKGDPTHANQLDREVVEEFRTDPARMRGEAMRLRAKLLGLRTDMLVDRGGVKAVVDMPKVLDVPAEEHRTASFAVTARRGERQAQRVEAMLTKRYRTARVDEGHAVTGKLILLPGQSSPLRIDLYDVDRAELIEAKGSVTREDVRMALGQVLDYARYVDHRQLAVLLPKYPGPDLVDLLSRHGVRCIYELAEGAFAREGEAGDHQAHPATPLPAR